MQNLFTSTQNEQEGSANDWRGRHAMSEMHDAAMVPDHRRRADRRALPATGLGGKSHWPSAVTSDHRIGDLRGRHPWFCGRALADAITDHGHTPAKRRMAHLSKQHGKNFLAMLTSSGIIDHLAQTGLVITHDSLW